MLGFYKSVSNEILHLHANKNKMLTKKLLFYFGSALLQFIYDSYKVRYLSLRKKANTVGRKLYETFQGAFEEAERS